MRQMTIRIGAGVQEAAAKCQGRRLPRAYMDSTPIAIMGTVIPDSQPLCSGWVISPTKIWMFGEYPAAANPPKNLPASIIPKFWEEAMSIHPRISGIAINISEILRPQWFPVMAEISPPNIAPSPKIPPEIRLEWYNDKSFKNVPIQDPSSIVAVKGR